MASLSDARVTVVGGGVVGLCTGLCLVRAGAQVTLYSAEPSAGTASGIAAGMLSAAMEAALEPGDGVQAFEILSQGRRLWPELMSSLGATAGLNRAGAVWVALPGEETRLESVLSRLRQVGAAAEGLDARQAVRLVPELSPSVVGAVYTPEDWTIEPRRVMPALMNALARAGARLITAPVMADGRGGFQVEGQGLGQDCTILAPGADVAPLVQAAPELACIAPIKGQLLAFDAPPTSGVTIRTAAAYMAPHSGGAIVGATMEPGLADRRPDANKLAALRAGAADVLPHLGAAPAEPRVAVRATTPDGWPLVGRSRASGVWLAAGMRRNGWTLAPMVADHLVRALMDEVAPAWAAVVDPARFRRVEP